MNYVHDASAMLAFLREESGAAIVTKCLAEPSSRHFAHSLNLCEVYYDFRRASTESDANAAVADLARIGIAELPLITGEFWRSAGALKAQWRRVSLADCFAIELARSQDAVLLTADRHELQVLADAGVCQVQFIR